MSILSLLFILLVHHLLYYFKNSLTVPKVNDLINSPTKNYEKMFHIISSLKEKEMIVKNTTDNICNNISTTNINEIVSNEPFIKETEEIHENILPLSNNTNQPDKKTMKEDLMMFLKNQINSTTEEIQPYHNQNQNLM
jgi:hypothetical protein